MTTFYFQKNMTNEFKIRKECIVTSLYLDEFEVWVNESEVPEVLSCQHICFIILLHFFYMSEIISNSNIFNKPPKKIISNLKWITATMAKFFNFTCHCMYFDIYHHLILKIYCANLPAYALYFHYQTRPNKYTTQKMKWKNENKRGTWV